MTVEFPQMNKSWWLGKTHSEESKKKMSNSAKGHIPWNKGKNGLQVAWNKGKKYGLGRKVPKCISCGKKLSSKSAKRCAKCSPRIRTGENHPNWKGGTSKGYKKGYRDNLAYKKWRKSVFERDDYTCQDCGITGVYITAHHIKSWAKYPDLRLEITNGKTLCEICHRKTDNYKGKAKKQ
jgi:5-methylcytosine-specific restriction endonuclease McrA